MSRYRDDNDSDRDEKFYETRRGRVRSYAEQQFEESQRRTEQADYERTSQGARQFDYREGDDRGDMQQKRERDERRSSMSGTRRDEERRSLARGGANADDDYRRGRMEYERLRGDEAPEDRYYTTTRFDHYDREHSRGREGERDTGRERIDNRGRMATSPDTERNAAGAQRSHVRCRDIMTRDVTCARRYTTLEEVARMMRDEDTGVIPVVEIEGEETHGLLIDQKPNATINPNAITDNAAQTSSPDTMQQYAANDLTPANTTDVSSTPSNQANQNAQGSTANQTIFDEATAQPHRRDEITNGRLIGLITDRDIVVRAIAEGFDATQSRAADIMTTDVHTADPNDRVIDAIRKMGDKQVRRIPVADRNGILRGIISMADIALETESDRELAAALEEISSGAGFWNKVF